MDFAAPHVGYVIASYAISAGVLLALGLSIWVKSRSHGDRE
jgi:hypothetical protein